MSSRESSVESWTWLVHSLLNLNAMITESKKPLHDKMSELQEFYLGKKKHWYFHLKQKMEPFSISTVPCHNMSYEKNN